MFGIALAAAAYAVSWSLFLWMTPVILGLLLSIPLAALTAHAGLGRGLRRLGLLLVPEERRPPEVLARANELAPELKQALPDCDAISRLLEDEALSAALGEMLEPLARRRGEIDADLVVGLARLDDAETPAEARRMLSDRELAAVLADPRGYARLLSVRR